MKRLLAWSFLVALIVAAERATADASGVVRMSALCFASFFGMKVVVSASEAAPLGWARWLAFVLLWPGMKPSTFTTAFGPRVPGGGALIARGLVESALGAAAIVVGRLVWQRTGSLFVSALFLLPGLSLVLHFGLLNFSVGGWRFLGVPGERFFRAPLLSRSLGEFWGRRWNRPFSEMSQVAIYQPLRSRIGKGPATFVVFVFSALAHEVVISVPAHGGYGLPTAYFLLHGALVLIERGARGRIERSVFARAWTLTWLAGPVFLLFHPLFLERVVWPLVGLTA